MLTSPKSFILEILWAPQQKPVNPSRIPHMPHVGPHPLPSFFPALSHKNPTHCHPHHPPTHTMFHSSSSPPSSSSSSSPYINDPAHAFYCSSMGPPPITNTLTLPYTLYDSTTTSNNNNTLSSSPPPFSSSLPSVNSYFMHRSNSTHSFTYPHPHHHQHHHQVAACSVPDPTLNPSFFSSSSSSLSSPPSSASCDHLLDFHSQTPVRRVFSTGDLQGMNCMQMQGLAATASTENCAQEGGKVGRYSAEERMKRIERYRSKRNHRNFHKKITVLLIISTCTI